MALPVPRKVVQVAMDNWWRRCIRDAAIQYNDGYVFAIENAQINVSLCDKNKVSLQLMQIPAGSFWMGSPPDEPERDEGPQHPVTLESFFMSQAPITQAQWREVAQWEPKEAERWERELNPNPSRFQHPGEARLLNNEASTDARPVESVSWDDAMEFCRRLSQRTGSHYTLPSEAQWEYACRAGTTTPFAFGETITPELANYDGNYTYGEGQKGEFREQTTPVGMFPANAWGLQDMHGNVWEWCLDHWHESYEGAPEDGSAWLAEGEKKRLLRGGSWDDGPAGSAARYHFQPDDAYDIIGFRVVCLPFSIPPIMSELTPPNHLVDKWTKDWEEIFPDMSLSLQRYISTKAADWQVEECARWLTEKDSCLVDGLYAAMRPKPKSLADMAISDWNLLQSDLVRHSMGISYFGNIERALKRLKELEGNQALPYLSPCPDADS